jgi:hypothetical protein
MRAPLGRLSLLALSLTTCMAHRPEAVAGPDELISTSVFPAAPVEVHEDAWGVPHVRAQSIEDAAWALGVLHAEERLWQMDLNRRIGEGRLSEILGERTLGADRFLRQRRLAASAQQALDGLSTEERAYLDAYAQGVNDAIASMKQLPPEYRLLRIEPAPWTALDSMVWIKVMALNLSGNVGAELLREDVIAKVGPERADLFLTGYPADGPRILPPDAMPPEHTGEQPAEDDGPGPREGRVGRGRGSGHHEPARARGPFRPGAPRRRALARLARGPGLQQLGDRRIEDRVGQADPGQRPAPGGRHALDLVPRGDRSARLPRGRRELSRFSRDRDRAQRAHRVGDHHRRARSARSVLRGDPRGRGARRGRLGPAAADRRDDSGASG